MEKTAIRFAVLYADVSGSTRLYETWGDKIASADIAACLDLLTRVVERLDGKVIKTIGDEIMCTFSNPVKAALAAGEMQTELKEAGEAGRFKSGPLRIKIGWHHGPAHWEHGDLKGEAPALAQQIIGLAKPGEVLTSRPSLKSLPPELKMNAHLVNRIAADSHGAELEVYSLPWEEDRDVTSFTEEESPDKITTHTSLLLEHSGKAYRVDKRNSPFSVGRSKDCDLQIEGQFASRRHAVIEFKHGRFHLRDESANGTILKNGDGREVRLHREEDLLVGNGAIGFGDAPGADLKCTVQFRCE